MIYSTMAGPALTPAQNETFQFLKRQGMGELDAKIVALQSKEKQEEFLQADEATRAMWLEGERGNPYYTMDPEQYAQFAASRQAQSVAMTEGEMNRLRQIAAARAADPEVAKTIDYRGGLTEYGAQQFNAASAAGRGLPGWVWIALAATAFFVWRENT